METSGPERIPRKPVGSAIVHRQSAALGGSHQQATPPSRLNEASPSHERRTSSISGPTADQNDVLLANDNDSDLSRANDEKREQPKKRSPWTQRVAQEFRRISNRDWFWEYASCLAAVGLSCAIIAVLATFNGRRLPQLPFRVSLNALISLLATALKASLIVPTAACIGQLKWSWYRQTRSLADINKYDEASRGPWGALVFLCSRRLPHLASLGAVLTVLAIAVDPFTQQVIRYRPCVSKYSNSTAAIVRAQKYNVSGDSASTGSQTYIKMMDLGMQAAIYQGAYGILANSTDQDLLGQCETGNCSFPHEAGIAYQSLGVCHKCADVSSSIINFCSNTTINGYQIQYCNYTMPLQANITSKYVTKINDSSLLGPSLEQDQNWQDSHVLNIAPEYTVSQLGFSDTYEYHPYPGISLIDANSIGKFAYIAFSEYSNRSADPVEKGVQDKPFGMECGLYPCIQSYNASVKGGLLQETVVHQQYLEWPNIANINLDAVASPCVIDGKVVDGSSIHISYQHALDSQDALGIENGTAVITGTSESNRGCLYHLDKAPLSALTRFFPTMFKGDVHDASVQSGSPDWLSQLWKNGQNNFTTTDMTMANIARSMTSQMRKTSIQSKPATGQIWYSETCVKVQWPWLTLHAVLVITCIMFLGFTVAVSSRQATGRLWKSSPLALMYHGLDAPTMEKVGMLDKVASMEDSAREMRVRLSLTDHGWRFAERTTP